MINNINISCKQSINKQIFYQKYKTFFDLNNDKSKKIPKLNLSIMNKKKVDDIKQ